MTERDFVFWLQGWIEMEEPKSISPQKLQMIKEHLVLVFQHVAGGPGGTVKETPRPSEKGPPASRREILDHKVTCDPKGPGLDFQKSAQEAAKRQAELLGPFRDIKPRGLIC